MKPCTQRQTPRTSLLSLASVALFDARKFVCQLITYSEVRKFLRRQLTKIPWNDDDQCLAAAEIATVAASSQKICRDELLVHLNQAL